jgi:hypothetical protein
MAKEFRLGFRLDQRLVIDRIAEYPFKRVASCAVLTDEIPMARQKMDTCDQLIDRAGGEIGFREAPGANQPGC